MLKKTVQRAVNALGYDIVAAYPPDLEEQFREIYQRSHGFTATSVERMYALYKAVQYVVEHRVPGDIVECGVWRGGSAMVCALTLKALGEMQRRIYMYDTYTGMPEEFTDKDVNYKGESAAAQLRKLPKKNIAWFVSSLDDVKNAMFSTGYPIRLMLFIKGMVEDTIPETAPDKISLLRLDTDWYASTYHEMLHLFPRLSPGGVLLIDDYGHWRSSKEAVDQYIQESDTTILLNRIDYTGRIGIKQVVKVEPDN